MPSVWLILIGTLLLVVIAALFGSPPTALVLGFALAGSVRMAVLMTLNFMDGNPRVMALVANFVYYLVSMAGYVLTSWGITTWSGIIG